MTILFFDFDASFDTLLAVSFCNNELPDKLKTQALCQEATNSQFYERILKSSNLSKSLASSISSADHSSAKLKLFIREHNIFDLQF